MEPSWAHVQSFTGTAATVQREMYTVPVVEIFLVKTHGNARRESRRELSHERKVVAPALFT